ncbi:putative AC transposase [Bienertia sinuspersici]
MDFYIWGTVCVTIEQSHDGFNIKTRIVICCKNFHLTDKILYISLDNATTNTKAMDFLKGDPSINLMLDGSLLHVRCCAHILDFFDQEGVAELQQLLEPIRSVIKWIRVPRTTIRAFKAKFEENGLRKKLLYHVITCRDVLTDLYNESRMDPNSLINNGNWSLAIAIHDILQSFDSATNIFFYVYELNIHMLILECIKIIYYISKATEGTQYVEVDDRLYEHYGAVIQPEFIRSSSNGKSRFGSVIGSILNKQRSYSSSSSSSSSRCR